MPRNISSGMLAALTQTTLYPAILAILAFKSQTVYVWSGVGTLNYASQNYLGVGDLGKIAAVTEGTDVQAYGTSAELSGINPTLLSESLTDIQVLAPATLMLALFDGNGNMQGTPLVFFQGTVGKPAVKPGVKTISISLALEMRLRMLQRASMRRYTSADQRLYFPGDSIFDWVEELENVALKFGG